MRGAGVLIVCGRANKVVRVSKRDPAALQFEDTNETWMRLAMRIEVLLGPFNRSMLQQPRVMLLRRNGGNTENTLVEGPSEDLHLDTHAKVR